MPFVEPLAILHNVHTRCLLFAPDGDLVFRREEGTWLRWDRATGGEHRLPFSGDRAAFFGRWLLVHHEGQSRALDWGNPDTLRECELGFDRGMQGFDPAVTRRPC